MDNQTAGIDFGTSHSRVMVAQDERTIQTVSLNLDKKIFPTAIFWGDETYYGRRAVDAHLRGARGYFAHNLKQMLALDVETEGVQVKRGMISFASIIRTFLHYLKKHVEETSVQHITDIVIGRPVRFSSDPAMDKKAATTLRDLCYQVGFKRVGFQYDTLAAALPYEQTIGSEEISFVADLGGGSSDFSVVRLSPTAALKPDRTSDILSSEGISLGGIHLDMDLSRHMVMPRLGSETYYQLSSQSFDKILSASETAKIKVSTATQADITSVQPDLNISITQSDFLKATEKTRHQIIDTAEATIKGARIDPNCIQSIILTGGSSQIPALANSICALCPKASVKKVSSFTAVGTGLALDAYRRFGRTR